VFAGGAATSDLLRRDDICTSPGSCRPVPIAWTARAGGPRSRGRARRARGTV